MERINPAPERSRPADFQGNLEVATNNTEKVKNQTNKEARKEKDSKLPLEGLARKVDPPSREVSDETLIDPGKMTSRARVDNRS
jgi:hypothetical protein